MTKTDKSETGKKKNSQRTKAKEMKREKTDKEELQKKAKLTHSEGRGTENFKRTGNIGRRDDKGGVNEK